MLSDIRCNFRHGVSVRLAFDQPKEVANLSSNNARTRYWEEGRGSRALQAGSLVVMIFNAPTDRLENDTPPEIDDDMIMVLATVLPFGRDRLGSGQQRATSLQLQPLSR